MNGAPVIYETVIEEISDINNVSLGKTEHIFNTSAAMTQLDLWTGQYPDPAAGYAAQPFTAKNILGLHFGDYIPYQRFYRYGDILEGETNIYDANNKLARATKRKYSHNIKKSFLGLLAQRKFQSNVDSYWHRAYFFFRNYYVEQLIQQLTEEITTDYVEGGEPVVTQKSYAYDDYGSLVTETISGSEKENQINSYKYPYNYSIAPYTQMKEKNMIAPVIEKRVNNNGKTSMILKNNYFVDAVRTKGLILPQDIETDFQGANKIVKEIEFERYGYNGKLLEYKEKDDISVIYIWSYNNQYPIAEIKNATYTEVENAIKSVFAVSSIDNFSTSQLPNETKLINGSLHNALPNAFVTTYTYDPLVGMTSSTDSSGKTTYYIYDTFGRLKRIEDTDRKIVEEYLYHYHKQ